MTEHPKWATKFKRKGTELRLLNGRYYLYEAKSKWDPEKKRPRKITGKLLGRITKEDGFVESDKAKLRKREFAVSKLSVKEYGITAFLDSHLEDYQSLLEKHFPKLWREIITLAYCKLVYKSSLKNVEFHYLHSYLSELFPGLSISPKNLTMVLKLIGGNRQRILDFFREFGVSDDNILFDGTDLVSNSRKMELTKFSKSKKGSFESLVNIMFIFSVTMKRPLYYRILPGNIKDIKAFKLSLEESQVNDAVIIADKGFYSENNIRLMRDENLKFVIPLRRNNTLINYERIKAGDKRNFGGFFKFENRVIWHYTTKEGNDKIDIFLDEELRAEEIKDYLDRTESLPEKYNMDEFHEKQYRFGTIALLNNLEKSARHIYTDYKSRSQIETMIDALKNVIGSDKSYMQNEQALEAWMFINYIVMHWYYRILQMLKSADLSSKYSPMDLISFLVEVRKVKINDRWFLAEITKKTQDLLGSLGIPIT